jgi:transcription antitermination factor NusG/transposase-like protein
MNWNVAKILDITAEFSQEEACLEYLEKLRWPEGVKCLKCGASKISRILSHGKTGKPRHLYQCLVCRTQFTVRTGTIFRDSHLPLTAWFKAIALICGSKKKMNVTRLQRHLNVQYRTASYLLHRIHRALESGGRLEVWTRGGPSASSVSNYRTYGKNVLTDILPEIKSARYGWKLRRALTRAGDPRKASIQERGTVAHRDELRWYALYVQRRYEKIVATGLENKGYEVFLPTYQFRKRWSGRTKLIELPLFPGYAFCRFDFQERLPIITVPGVNFIVGIGRTPTPVDLTELEAVRTVVASGLPCEPWPFITVGHAVRVEHGALAGLEGLVLNVKNSCRLIISVNLLGRSVAVELNRDDVKSIAPPKTYHHSLSL